MSHQEGGGGTEPLTLSVLVRSTDSALQMSQVKVSVVPNCLLLSSSGLQRLAQGHLWLESPLNLGPVSCFKGKGHFVDHIWRGGSQRDRACVVLLCVTFGESFVETALYISDGCVKCSLPHRSENAAREVRMSFMLREQSMDERNKAPCVSHR